MGTGRRGFTLIELMIVISVISILLVLLAPTIRAIRATARRTVCTGNLQQIYYAIMDYAEDYRDRLPYATTLNHPPSYWRQLHHILGDYVQDGTAIFQCPADMGSASLSTYTEYFGCSYQNRADMTNAAWRGLTPEQYMPFAWQLVDYCPEPSRLAIIRDGVGWHHLGRGVAKGSTRGEQFIFLDGHVVYNSDEKWWGYGGGIW